MKFNFNDITYADVTVYPLLKDRPVRSESECTVQSIRAEKLLEILLTEPKKGLSSKDSISEFYSVIRKIHMGVLNHGQTNEKSISDCFSLQKRNLAINKNTADHHGRT